MLPENKKNVLAALKRLNGLIKKLEQMTKENSHCPKILEMSLAIKGHMEYIQAQILESHLQTCHSGQLTSSENKKFVKELIKVIGLSKR